MNEKRADDMKVKHIFSFSFCVIFFASCASSPPAPFSSTPSSSYTEGISSTESINISKTPLSLSADTGINFLYDDATEISSLDTSATKQAGWIEVTDDNVYYIFSRGNTYGIKKRSLSSNVDTILFETDELVLISFIRINDSRFLLRSHVYLTPTAAPDSQPFSCTFLYEYDVASQQLRSLTELYGLEKYGGGGAALLEGREFIWKGPDISFYAYSNGYIYLDSREVSDEWPGVRVLLRISPKGIVERLPIEHNDTKYPYGTGISVSGSFVYIVGDNDTLYAVHESGTESKPVISWSGDIFSVTIQDGYIYTEARENSSDSVLLYHRVNLQKMVLVDEATINDGSVHMMEKICFLPDGNYQKMLLEYARESDSGDRNCTAEDIYCYAWDGELIYSFKDIKHPGYNRGHTLHEGSLYYLDSFGGDIVLKTMQPSA